MEENTASTVDNSACRIDPTADSEWDSDLATCRDASFFHGSAWARVLASAYGYTPVYFALRNAQGIHSLLPMMEVESWLTGSRGISLPFTDECAPLCADPESFRHLYREALDLARLRHWKYIEFRGGMPLFDGAPSSINFFGHRLDLRGGEAALFARCDSSVRRAVRKADQSGLTFEFSRDLEAVRTFHGLLCKTRRRHGVPPQPFNFFASIHRHVLAQNQGWIVLARLGQTPVAGAVFFHFGKTVIYKFGASDDAFQHTRANNGVMWEAIKRHGREGFEVLDFGRTSNTNEGLRNFKLGWGASEHLIDYVRFDCRIGGYVVAGDPSSGGYTRILRMLPEPMFRLVGRVLYKHMA